MKRKKIFFEKVSFIHYPFLLWYLWRGHKVLVFDFNRKMKKSKLLRNLINSRKIHRIYIKSNAKEHGLAIDQTEIIYKHYKNKKIAEILSDLYETKEINFAFKKVLLSEIFKCIYINQYLSDEKKKQKNSTEIFFVPHDYYFYEKMICSYSNYDLKPLDSVKLQRLYRHILPLIKMCYNAKWRLVASFYLYSKITLLYFKNLSAKENPKKIYFQSAIPIDQEFQIKSKGKKSFDFLLDHKEINKKNTVFILNHPVSKNFLSEYQERGYQFLNTKDIFSIRHETKYYLSGKLLCHAFLAVSKMLFTGSSCSPFLICFVYGINIFLKWNIILTQISINNYIYTNQESFPQIFNNILVRKQGGQTWNYSSFIGGGLIYSKDNNFNDCRHIFWAFLNSDHFLTVNEDVVKYYKLHCQAVQKYHNIGSIYSEMVRESSNVTNRNEFIKNKFRDNFRNQTKIVSFFDTSFIDSEDAVTTFQNAIDFYRDIIKLISDHSDIFVIIKPSKGESAFVSPHDQWSSLKKGKKIIRLWDHLQEHPRVYWAGHSGDTPNIIAASDIVVTHCLSSPTVEALGARKKAFWYESGNKHRGLMYSKIPGLIVHSYKELVIRLEYLLYEVTDEEYNEYLNNNIKSKIEYQLDGLALTRFRRLISIEKKQSSLE